MPDDKPTTVARGYEVVHRDTVMLTGKRFFDMLLKPDDPCCLMMPGGQAVMDADGQRPFTYRNTQQAVDDSHVIAGLLAEDPGSTEGRSETKERAITVEGSLVRALVEGRKTQARFVCKRDPRFAFPYELDHRLRTWDEYIGMGEPWASRAATYRDELLRSCPFGVVGDRLWLKEAWSPCGDGGAVWFKAGIPVYRAGRRTGEWAADDRVVGIPVPTGVRWRSPARMPRSASRVSLEIIGVRVQQLQDISEADAQAEGAQRPWLTSGVLESEDGTEITVHPLTGYYADGYRELWESTYGEGTWATNPWVWAVEFKSM